MSDFEVFYRGVAVPDGIADVVVFDSASKLAFQGGVDAVMKLQEGSDETPVFVGRVFIDNDGDQWHEQSPDSFDCRYANGIWSTGYKHYTEEEILLNHRPVVLTNLIAAVHA